MVWIAFLITFWSSSSGVITASTTWVADRPLLALGARLPSRMTLAALSARGSSSCLTVLVSPVMSASMPESKAS